MRQYLVPAAYAVLVACLFVGSNAHAGTMHNISGTDYNAKVSAGSCSNWVTPTTTRTSSTKTTQAKASRLAASGRHLLAAIDAKGTARMYVKLDGDNCTDSYYTSVVINVTLTEGAKPLSNATINGSVNTGKCNQGGGSVFLQNVTAGDDKHNKIFFRPIQTDEQGRIVGSFANDGIVRVSGTGSAESVVLYSSGKAILCCDLITSEPSVGFAKALAPSAKNCTADEAGADQLGMIMDGEWMACSTKINGSYYMQHGDSYALCNEYRNGSKATTATTAGTSGSSKTNSAVAVGGESWFVAMLLVAAAALAL